MPASLCLRVFASVRCVWAVISNDHEDIPRAFRGAQRLHGHLSAGPQGLLVESAVAIFNKSTDEICQELSQAATCLDSHGLSKIFFVYYAGHVVSDYPDFYYIEPIPGQSNIDLTYAAMKSVSNRNLERVNTTVFLDGCARQVAPQEEEETVKSHWTNTFTTLCPASFGHGVRDGAILVRCLQHCCELKFATVDDFLNGVLELTRQLSFGGLFARHIHPTELNPLLELPFPKEHTSGGTCFLRFALHLWTDEWLESDDHQEVDLSPLIHTLREVVCLLVTCDMWSGADAWGELQVLSCCQSLDDVLAELQNHDRKIQWKLQCDSVPEYIRKYLVEAVVEAVRAWHNQNGILDEPPDVEDVVERLGSLCSRITRWYELLYEGTQDATGRRYRFLKVEGAVPEQFTGAEMQETATEVQEVCQYFGIRAQVCLVPGSLWAIFCSEEPPNPDQRKGFCEKFGRWVEERRKSGVRGWSRAEPPCWKPSHAVPSRIRNVVQKVQNFVDTDSGSAPCCMWLRACTLRRLVARSCSQRNPEERYEAWRVVIFEGLSEIRGSAWLQGAGDLRCVVLRNLWDESFGEQLADLVGVADRRGLQMRPEIPALLFLAQEAGVELQQEDLVQVMASGGQEVLRSYVKQFIREVLSQRQDAKLKLLASKEVMGTDASAIYVFYAGDPAIEGEGGGNFTQALCRFGLPSVPTPATDSGHSAFGVPIFLALLCCMVCCLVGDSACMYRALRASHRPALRPQAGGRRHALVLSCVRFLERGKVQFDMESQRSGESMAKLLKELGYHVLHFQDPDQETVQAGLKFIAAESDAESTTFIFYAGPVFQDEVGQLMRLFIDPARGQQVFHLGKWILDLQRNLVPRTSGLKPASGTNMVFAMDGCSKTPPPESTGAEAPIPTPPSKKLPWYMYKGYKGGLCCILSCAVSQHDRRDFSESLLGHLRIAKSAADLCDGISADCRNSGSRPWIMSSGDLSAISLGNPSHDPVSSLPCARKYPRRYGCHTRRLNILTVIAACLPLLGLGCLRV
ncbi:unnamed protein product [Symbiodinium necroappetens]|uniref:Caspase family p20 domain-containing protein n=1 Tax=Symbiodinium necroappetens TaxID=1628268 RepID=A0A812SVM9_9DINO|nr:unnamed protein product [Symbiodinium necroappetens]